MVTFDNYNDKCNKSILTFDLLGQGDTCCALIKFIC